MIVNADKAAGTKEFLGMNKSISILFYSVFLLRGRKESRLTFLANLLQMTSPGEARATF